MKEKVILIIDIFRWTMVSQLLGKVKDLEGEPAVTVTASVPPAGTTVTRWEGGKEHHHWDQVVEYIHPDQVPIELARIAANPAVRPSKPRGRRRDADRADGKVKNPSYQDSSPCIVCKFYYNRTRHTSLYCRECQIESN